MTRFGLTPKAPINYQAPATPHSSQFRQWPAQTVTMRRLNSQGIAAESPQATGGILAEARFFDDSDTSLLIVAALFFIHRRNGEVAEWSKALPC
ncbi:hypothetical protein NKH17_19255 [Mesorhizobium sp. M1334]